MSELFIPEGLHEMYTEAIAHPNEYWAPGVVKSLIECIAILDAENVAVWEAVGKFCGASEKKAISDYVMVADEKPPV